MDAKSSPGWNGRFNSLLVCPAYQQALPGVGPELVLAHGKAVIIRSGFPSSLHKVSATNRTAFNSRDRMAILFFDCSALLCDVRPKLALAMPYECSLLGLTLTLKQRLLIDCSGPHTTNVMNGAFRSRATVLTRLSHRKYSRSRGPGDSVIATATEEGNDKRDFERSLKPC